jgi:hypothetical protein
MSRDTAAKNEREGGNVSGHRPNRSNAHQFDRLPLSDLAAVTPNGWRLSTQNC